VQIDIYDIYASHIISITDNIYNKGIILPYLQWDLKNKLEELVPTGVYIAVIKINSHITRKKIIIVK